MHFLQQFFFDDTTTTHHFPASRAIRLQIHPSADGWNLKQTVKTKVLAQTVRRGFRQADTKKILSNSP